MDLETLIIAVFCLTDDFIRDTYRGCRLRQRGPAPLLADSEVLTIEKRWPAWLVQTRRRIETVLGQLTERYHAKQVRARPEWPFVARWLCRLVSHTVAGF